MSNDVSSLGHGDGIVEVRLQRPERMNALGVETVAALSRAFAEARSARARVVLVCGSGKAFCAGADLKERQSMDPTQRVAHNAGINAAINAIADAPFVSIAVLNGFAFGGGLEMALACDLRFAAAGIQVGLTESRIGAFPGAGGTQRLPRLVGVSRALKMMMSGEPVSSEHAHTIGLVDELAPPAELDSRAQAFARVLASRSAPALATLKQLVYRGIERPLAEALAMERAAVPGLLASSDYAEGLAAFADRRPPRFTGTVE